MTAFDYTIIRNKKRKRVVISITPENTVKVSAPNWIAKSRIIEFVEEKSDWIQKHLKKNKLKKPKPSFTGNHTDEFYYLGSPITLKKILEIANIKQDLPTEKIKTKLLKWYRQLATEIIEDRVLIWSKHIPKKPKIIRFKTMRSRWGSCSSLDNLNFNWKLIMAPLDVIDYVVIHELCHLIQHNHSPKFWALVESIMPDYKSHKKWLGEHGYLLTI